MEKDKIITNRDKLKEVFHDTEFYLSYYVQMLKGLDLDYELKNVPMNDWLNSEYEDKNEEKKLSKEHPHKKYKVSKIEYDILKTFINYPYSAYSFKNNILMSLLEEGYFEGATSRTSIRDYFDNCEIVDRWWLIKK